jgi:hypothetical protein
MAMISSIQGLAPGKLLFVKGLPTSIHASVIAEGIETSDELATVQSLGVTYG